MNFVNITEINNKALQDYINKNTHTYVCDECKKTFPVKDVLAQVTNNFSVSGPLRIVSVVDTEDNTYYFYCPHCKRPHIFGFEVKS